MLNIHNFEKIVIIKHKRYDVNHLISETVFKIDYISRPIPALILSLLFK
jgi:hypothetical protein